MLPRPWSFEEADPGRTTAHLGDQRGLRVVDLFAVFHGDTTISFADGHAETTNGLKPRL